MIYSEFEACFARSESLASVLVEVDVPVAQAWSILQDFSQAHNYVPNLSKTEIVSAQKNGVGRVVYYSEDAK